MVLVDVLLFKDPDPVAKVPVHLDPDPQHWFKPHYSFLQDLVKSHLMSAVRSEVEELRDRITKLEVAIHPSNNAFIHPFIHLFVHSFIYSFIHLFIHSFVRSFIHSFIH